MWSHTGPKDPKDSKRFVISSSLKQSVTSEGRVPCVEAIKTSWRWTEQEEHSSDLSVDNEITRIGMVMGSLNVSDVDDRTDVDWFKILIEQLIRFRYFSRFWTSSALRSCALTKVMGRISESPGFHMLVCRSIRACFASFCVCGVCSPWDQSNCVLSIELWCSFAWLLALWHGSVSSNPCSVVFSFFLNFFMPPSPPFWLALLSTWFDF